MMASENVDEFVLNFDLNQLQQPNEATLKSLEQKYERLRKNVQVVKSTVITTHYMLQKYRKKKEEYEQLLKAHAAIREELTQLYVRYKDASDECAKLEDEKKMLLTSREKLNGEKIDSDNKYCGLLSHSNQLQNLVKQLEIERDALKVEKELDKCSDKETTREVIKLQEVNAAMLIDLLAMKDVILGKKKTRKKHIKIFEKYEKNIVCKEVDMSSSDESNNDTDSPANFKFNTPRDLKMVVEIADKKITTSAEQNFVDNCSDSSNEEISVDTGRGSSRANSHDKCLSSPDYLFTSETVLKPPHKNVKQREVATSPITVYPPISVATSPIIFDHPAPFDDQYDDYGDCSDVSEIIMETVHLSEELDEIHEKDKFTDVCTNPIPDVRRFIDSGTDPIENDVYGCMESSNKSITILTNNESSKSEELKECSLITKTQRCFCQRDNYKKNIVDSCTSPIPESIDYCRFVEIGTSTINDVDILNLDGWSDLQNQTSRYTEKSSFSEIVTKPNNKYVDACTSPISEFDNNMCVDVGRNVNNMNMVNSKEGELGNDCSKNCNKSTCTGNITQIKKFVGASTNKVSRSGEQCELVDEQSNEMFIDQNDMIILRSNNNQEESQQLNVRNESISRPINEKTISIGNKITPPTERLSRREKVCLESNSSKKLSFENINDCEVQNILNVMKLHNDLVSPISKTPSDSHYLTLLPEMNSTLTKIWAAISHIYKTPISNINSNSPHLNQNEIPEIPNEETSSSNNKSQSKQFIINREEQENTVVREENDEIVDENVIDIANDPIEATGSILEDNVSLETSNTDVNGTSDIMNSKLTNLEIITNIDLSQGNKSDEVITIEEEERTNSNQKIIESYKEVNNISQNDVINSSNTNIDNVETVRETAGYTEVPKVKRSTKTKIKSKLEKLREKLVPTCKIRKMDSSINKQPVKAHNFKPKQPNSSLNQKLAYEKAVIVMRELRLNKERQAETKQLSRISKSIKLASSSNKIEPIKDDLFEVKTRNRTRNERFRKKDEETTATVMSQKSRSIEQGLKDIEKSPRDRKLRKRPADTEVSSPQVSCKRVLRSANVSQVTHVMELPIVRQNKSTESLNCEKRPKHQEKNDHDKTSSSKLFSNKRNSALENENINRSSKITDKDHDEPVKSHIMIEKNKRMTQPIIDLSNCLNDNPDVVSIVPGNNYSDVKTSTYASTTGFNRRNMLVIQNNYANINRNEPNKAKVSNDLVIEKELAATSNINTNQITNNPLERLSNSSKEIEPDVVNKRMKRHVNIDDNVCSKNVMELCNTETQNENNSDSISDVQRVNVTKQDVMQQRNINITTDQTVLQSGITNVKDAISTSIQDKQRVEHRKILRNPVIQLVPLANDILSSCVNNIVNYSDLALYTDNNKLQYRTDKKTSKNSACWKENILCAALDRYGVISVKYVARKVPDTITVNISQKFEESIANIIASPKSEQKTKMDQLVMGIEHHKPKYILSGLMKYLKDSTRKMELFNTLINGAAPPMTRSEMILLYVIEKLNESLPSGFLERVWSNMEHALFQLNRAPEFCVIESMSHFYAVLCRYFRNKSRLRCFMLDAMYCLQFKAVPLIRQCLEVCPGVLPYAHEQMAKTSLVTCLVYLLHFYKCQDKFNRAQDIRNILHRKYSYRFSEWNETMILEIFRKAIMDLRGTYNDKKMLRLALIILCKRHGAKWCHINIIQNMLLPIIDKEDVPERIKQFCVLMLGPLLKPFPADRKAQCEIVINQLLQMLKKKNSQGMTEAIYSSLIFMNKHDQERVVQALLYWNPENISPDFEEILNDYVMEKPLAVWKKLVTKKPSQCS